jgi:hypothetical protein
MTTISSTPSVLSSLPSSSTLASSISTPPSASTLASSVFDTSSASASITSADWMDPSAAGTSSGFLDSSNSGTTTADAYFAADSALSGALATVWSNDIQGQGTLAGESALTRVNTAIRQKQQAAENSSPVAATGGGNGYATVQNLMASLDNITINNGSAAPAPVSSSSAASGYAVVQNLMTSLDNITINTGGTGTTAPTLTAQNLLASVDAITAKPLNVTA